MSKTFKMHCQFAVVSVLFVSTAICQEVGSSEKYDIEGKILVPSDDPTWVTNTQVYIGGGMYIGFLRYVLP